jgi:glyoxylase-like metal-dependent hydrolase (beta-lactamase superfamily II)
MPDVSVTPLGHDLYLIDAFMHDRPENLACYLFDTPRRVLVECGPSRSISHLFDALHHLGIDDAETLAITHIHLDHAGGAGHFAAHFPGAQVAVHRLGAPHLVDPTRLMASAAQAYADDPAQGDWGPMEPIDPARLRVLDEGDRIPLGGGRAIDVMYTPGHARHHLVYFEAESGACLVGDEVGVCFPHGHAVQPNTPPPDFDPELITEQLHRIGARHPSFLGFAHYGLHTDPPGALAEAEERLWEWVHWIEHHEPAGTTAGEFRRWALGGHRARGMTEADVAHYDQHTSWPMQSAGVRRWLQRRHSTP